ncbi:hypothetical protein FHX42_001994 [Saccharopolyspora lacisalsi]|uniref:S-adenosyl methyltransferase n=1 Tax=Halosaccharopolyspora lacisalsi TaxID=1000566 RepID=A0A839DYT2_9PSEU|nr:SAM-dependent methyltransferase [Halosaccharopolyspora lacisalsi]MBA8824647.1 hypothetical protein [Halosaccharopolyspora lacisalsi]
MSTETEGDAARFPGVDLSRPSAARIYDWYLGGAHNWAIDREFGARIETMLPPIKALARSNRAFLGRLVRAALDSGIRQFLDIGSGIPAVGNVHEIVRQHGADARVVYVDYEPVAAAHSRMLLQQEEATGWAGIVQQDFLAPSAVLESPETRRLIDFDQPVCLLLIALGHFLGDEADVPGVLDRYRDRLVAGSWLGLSHIACDDATPEQQEQMRGGAASYQDTSNPLWLRDRAELARWFGPWPLLSPGMVHLPDWRPDVPDEPLSEEEAQARGLAWCGVATRPD